MAASASLSPPAPRASLAISVTMSWNLSLRATKSVSELTSTNAPLLPSVVAPINPSAATRPAFLAACASPLVRSQSMAASISPSDSVRAFLQSIMPAPVVSRSSFTIAAVIVVIACPYLRVCAVRVRKSICEVGPSETQAASAIKALACSIQLSRSIRPLNARASSISAIAASESSAIWR